MNKKFAQNLIDKTRDDYNKISAQFASTRKKGVWPDNLEALAAMNLKPGESVLDVGAGSGRLYPYLNEKGLVYQGVDLCYKLINEAKKAYPKGKFSLGDATDLPFADNSFDHTFSVAVLYHIPSKSLRVKALSEIYRVTRPGGTVYISVWYFWNKPKDIRLILSSYFSTLWRGILSLFSNISNDSALDFGDFYRPWKTPDGEVATDRYCHAWTLGELKRGLKKVGFHNFRIIKSNKKTLNINIVCKK